MDVPKCNLCNSRLLTFYALAHPNVYNVLADLTLFIKLVSGDRTVFKSGQNNTGQLRTYNMQTVQRWTEI